MPIKQPATRRMLACPGCGGGAFSISLLKDEGVGVANCIGCARDYLLFDSGDYWFDVIQKHYPRARRCACKETAFRLRADYWLREDGDVDAIQLWSACTSCAKEKRELSLDIDYSPTRVLLERPLVFCAKPKLLYDLKELGLFATPARIAGVVQFLHQQEGCTFVASLREGDAWVRRPLDGFVAAEAVAAARESGLGRYRWIYALPTPLDVPLDIDRSARQEGVFWKTREVIRISSPLGMRDGDLAAMLYYIEFANERVIGDTVRAKSAEFRAVTGRLMQWLAMHFVSWRGPSSFDDEAEHLRYFGDRFKERKR